MSARSNTLHSVCRQLSFLLSSSKTWYNSLNRMSFAGRNCATHRRIYISDAFSTVVIRTVFSAIRLSDIRLSGVGTTESVTRMSDLRRL